MFDSESQDGCQVANQEIEIGTVAELPSHIPQPQEQLVEAHPLKLNSRNTEEPQNVDYRSNTSALSPTSNINTAILSDHAKQWSYQHPRLQIGSPTAAKVPVIDTPKFAAKP